MTVRSFRLVPVLLLILVVTGCRTYGDYGTEAELQEQIAKITSDFADNLARTEADLQVLERAAADRGDLAPLVERFKSNLESHRELLAHHRDIAERLSDSGNYRALHRNYGAITTEQRMMRQGYNQTIRRIQTVVSGDASFELKPLPLRSFYFVEPLEYVRMENPRQITMEEALNL
ncbi:hypothetical protein CRI94_07550 [Longibacter salinarum]|uniref:LemA family protein n=1 Tax=Longibacter salinarum TaxID=1850348 RepID=A0A2A8CYW3_9BACT|nr:hypothetical protein [Longibacter salinarum]PEN13902.1 hypothetical protein CRI94_07550 [Longibacter salinarum]